MSISRDNLTAAKIWGITVNDWIQADNLSGFPSSAAVVAALASTSTGATLIATVNGDDRIYKFAEQTVDGVVEQAAEVFEVITVDGEVSLRRVAASYNGAFVTRGSIALAAATGAQCTGCPTTTGPGDRSTREFAICNTDWNTGCILSTLGCLACTASCAGTALACGACIALSCGSALATAGSCCNGTYTVECRRCAAPL